MSPPHSVVRITNSGALRHSGQGMRRCSMTSLHTEQKTWPQEYISKLCLVSQQIQHVLAS